jgi:hypothetical protein
LGIATDTVMPENGPSAKPGNNSAIVKVAVSPVAVAVVHGELEPYGPDAQLTFVIPTGAWTVTVGAPMGTFHSVPIAFHTSSSWSVKPFIAPRTRYVIS